MKLTPKQRSALLCAYRSDGSVIADPWEGVHPRTARSLAKRGWLRADADEGDVYWLTAEGEEALGLPQARTQRPATLQAALELAASTLGLYDVDVVSDETGPQPDEGEADWSDVLAWLRFEPRMDDEDDEAFEALEKLVGELGFDIAIDRAREGLLAVWPGDI